MLNDTIAAISTALQDGAISVIRISGPDSLAIAGRLFSRRVDDQILSVRKLSTRCC